MRAVVRYLTPGIAAIGLVLVAAGCSTTQNPVSPAPVAAETQSPLQGDPGLGPQLAAVRDATDQFHDVSAALAAGYLNPAGIPCEHNAIGTMGIHSSNPALAGNQTLDPLHPKVLLYLPKPEGGFRLVAVEYVQFVLLRNPATNQVAPWTSHSPWPSNYQVVTPTPALFGQTFNGPMPGHVPGMPWHWDLHVWIWANNPTGIFQQWNPAISCI
ncbi:MAG TPA: hypothetical protein VEL51_05285 [Vicinamibacterales bacterium]|nr:hypothetical protein [Vicinamibacterales bacterium]